MNKHMQELEKQAREDALEQGQEDYEPVWDECPICRMPFIMGFNGVCESESGSAIGCDDCLGLERDNTFQHNVWWPDESEHVFSPLWGQYKFTMTRGEAFGPNANEIFCKRGGLV